MFKFNKIKRIWVILKSHDGSLQRKTIRSGFWVGFSSIVINTLSLIRSIILARLLTPEIFGLMSICLIVVRGIEIFTETGFNAALIHRQKNFEEEKDTAFTLMVLRGFILASVTFLIAPLAAIYYERQVLETIVKVIAISFIFKGFHNINIIAYQKELDFKRLSYLEQAINIINFMIVVTLVYFLRSVWALVIGQVVASLIGTVLSFIIIRGRPRIRFNKDIAKELFKYGKFITGLTIVVFITTEIDNVVVGKILGMNVLGYYVLAYTLANLPATHITKIISRVMLPVYSKLQNNLPALQEAYLKVLRLIAMLTIPAAAGIAVLAPEIIRIVYGEKWMPAVDSLRILTLFGCIRALGSINGYLYNAIGKPNIPFYMNTGKLLFVIALIYPLTANYQLIGASIAVTIPSILQFFLEIYIFIRVINIKIFKIIRILTVITAYSCIMSLVVLYFKGIILPANIYTLFILIFLGMGTYALLNFRYITGHIRKLKSPQYS